METRPSERTTEPPDPRSKVVLQPDVAEELIDLIVDEPGHADEDLLDAALAAFDNTHRRIPTEDQERAAEGEVVAIEVPPEAVDAVTTLVLEDRAEQPRLLKRLAGRLRSKIKKAAARRAA